MHIADDYFPFFTNDSEKKAIIFECLQAQIQNKN